MAFTLVRLPILGGVAILPESAARALCSWFALLFIGIGAFHSTQVDAQIAINLCGSLQQANGPWDFRTVSKDIKQLVERPHYDKQAALVLRGGTKSQLGAIVGDLDYTLRAFPNHPGALIALDKVAVALNTEMLNMANWTLECYYLRGMKYAPDDGMVPYLYSRYLTRKGRMEEARRHLDASVALLESSGVASPNVLYNIGLGYFEFREYELAQSFAERAAAGGYELPGLKQKLMRIGKWKAAPDNRSNDVGVSR